MQFSIRLLLAVFLSHQFLRKIRVAEGGARETRITYILITRKKLDLASADACRSRNPFVQSGKPCLIVA